MFENLLSVRRGNLGYILKFESKIPNKDVMSFMPFEDFKSLSKSDQDKIEELAKK